VQAKTFSCTLQCIGYVNGNVRFGQNRIIENLMLLQELFIIDDDVNYYKKMKSKSFYTYIITNKNLINNGIVLSLENERRLNVFFENFYNSDSYLNEYELLNNLNKLKRNNNDTK